MSDQIVFVTLELEPTLYTEFGIENDRERIEEFLDAVGFKVELDGVRLPAWTFWSETTQDRPLSRFDTEVRGAVYEATRGDDERKIRRVLIARARKDEFGFLVSSPAEEDDEEDELV